MKKILILMAGLLMSIASFAQDSAPAESSFAADPLHHPMFPYYATVALLMIVILLVAVVCIYVFKIVRLLNEQLEKQRASRQGVAYVPSPGWWSRFTQAVNASVPVAQEKEIELEHNYDGIKELDNHLPPWWKWLFYGTIAWAAIYIIVFHIANTLPLSQEEYQTELAVAETQAKLRKASQPAAAEIDESKLVYSADAAILENGKNVFAENPCGSCHGSEGGGNTIGPNLTDQYWIHGGDITSIFNTIKNGAVDKGMPAWGKVMSVQDVRDLTFYIISLQGSNPPNPKAPQGELYKPASPMQSDSTSVKSQASL